MKRTKRGVVALMLSLSLAGSALTSIAAAKQATVKVAPIIQISGGPKAVRRLTTTSNIMLAVPNNIKIKSITLHTTKGTNSYDETELAKAEKAEETVRYQLDLKDKQIEAGNYVLVLKTEDGTETQKVIRLREAKPEEETKQENAE